MPITINGSGTVTGISAGGLPDDCITTAEIAAAAVTTAKLGSNEASGLAKAWVNFNGTGTVAIRASYNVSSITDNAVGNYTVNFTTAFADVNYCAAMNARTGGGAQAIITLNRDSTPTTTAHPVYVVNPATPGVLQDEAFCHIAFFR